MVQLTKQQKRKRKKKNQRNQQAEVVDKQTHKKKILGLGTIEFQS
jgi:hypothetical protein